MTQYYRSPEYTCSVLRQFVFITSFLTGLWLLSSCKETPTMIGSKILPPSDYTSIFSTDTFKITSYTNYISEVNTEDLKTPYIGVYNDPYFGTTTSGFVTQLRLEEKWWWEDRIVKVDSVKLVLRITSNYGSNDDFRHYLRISEISDMLYNDTAYDFNYPVDTTGYGVSAFIPPLSSDTTIHKIEIKLPNSFGEHMIRDTSMLFYATDANEQDFRDYFRGIYITIPSASATNPFLLGFDFTYGSAYDEERYDYYGNYIIVHMTCTGDDSTTWQDSYRFLLDSRRDNAHFTKIEHDFSANIKNAIDYKTVDSLSYVQGLYGAYTTISIPGLEAIKNDPARARSAVNKARLTVPVHPDYITFADSTAHNLYMRYVNADGEREMVPDYYIGSDQDEYEYDYYTGEYVVSSTTYKSYFDGTLDAEKNVYNFNLSNFVQTYFRDTENKLKPELEIFLPADNVLNAILKANDSKTPLKFELTLTNY